MNFKDKSQIALYLICAIAASFLLSLVLLQLFTGLLILLWLLESNSEKKKMLGNIEIYFLAFVCVRVLSIIFSEHFALSVHALYKDALYYVGFFALSFYLNSFTSDKKRKILEIFLSFALLVAIIGITKFVFGIIYVKNKLNVQVK